MTFEQIENSYIAYKTAQNDLFDALEALPYIAPPQTLVIESGSELSAYESAESAYETRNAEREAAQASGDAAISAALQDFLSKVKRGVWFRFLVDGQKTFVAVGSDSRLYEIDGAELPENLPNIN